MNVRERNINNVISRWRKQHDKELKWIKSHKNVDIFKARLCGYLAGDGNISSRKERTSNKIHHEIRFFPDNISLIEPYLIAFRKAYNKTPKVTRKNNHYEIRINSKVVFKDLISFCSFGLKSWTVPNFSDNKCKSEWLRAMFDSDSYMGHKYIRLKTVNENGLKVVRNMLDDFGIDTKFYSYKPKNDNWNTNYILDIRQIDSLKRFSYIIGFNHKLKKEKLINLICREKIMPRL